MKRKKSKNTGKSPSIANLEIAQIEQLLRYMREHNLEEFEYSRGDLKIRLKKPGTSLPAAAPRSAPEIIVPAAVATLGGAESTSVEASDELRGGEDLHLVKSPIVGTFYTAASPGSAPFVTVGARVEAGQVLCIIEAMKLMNEIESDVAGDVVRIFVENGQPVEYGEPLFGIHPHRKK